MRLALGWASVFVAFGTGLYGWKIDFEKSKPVVWTGVILYVRPPAPMMPRPVSLMVSPLFTTFRYVILSLVQTLYAYFIERDIVFLGKRKTFDKRVSHRISWNPRTPLTHPNSFLRS